MILLESLLFSLLIVTALAGIFTGGTDRSIALDFKEVRNILEYNWAILPTKPLICYWYLFYLIGFHALGKKGDWYEGK